MGNVLLVSDVLHSDLTFAYITNDHGTSVTICPHTDFLQ